MQQKILVDFLLGSSPVFLFRNSSVITPVVCESCWHE